MAFSDIELFRVNGGALYVLADGTASAALTAQGFAVSDTDIATANFTNASPNVGTAAALSAHIGQHLIDESSKRMYRIVNAVDGITYNISPDFSGTTGAYAFKRFQGPSGKISNVDQSTWGY